MALTEEQRAAVRLYVGWPARFHQYDSRLEQALDAVGSLPDHEAQILNGLGDDPPGLLAQLKEIDAELRTARVRLKASQVGAITLNPGELSQRRAEGRRLVSRICTILGIARGADVFSSGAGSFAGYGMSAPNYVGK